MIKLEVEERCQNCPKFEPTAEKCNIYADNMARYTETTIQCTHKNFCDQLWETFKKIREIQDA